MRPRYCLTPLFFPAHITVPGLVARVRPAQNVLKFSQFERAFFILRRLEEVQRCGRIRFFGKACDFFRGELAVDGHFGDAVRQCDVIPEEVINDPVGKSLKICCRGRHDKHQNMSPNEGVGTESSDRVLVRKAVRSWPALGSSSPERLNASYALSMSSACFTALRVISVFIPL